MIEPLVSIGVPVYNGEEYLALALESVLEQTYHNIEIVISDNASTDGTEEIGRGFADRDPRIRYIRQDRNHGATWNFNRVFELSQGEYFKWAAHDDIILPTFLAVCVGLLEANPNCVLACTGTSVIDDSGRLIDAYDEPVAIDAGSAVERFRQSLGIFGKLHPIHMAGVFRASVLRAAGPYGSYAHADRIYVAKVALRGSILQDPAMLFRQRVHAHSSMRENGSGQALAAWYNPEYGDKIALTWWRRYFEFVRAVAQAPISTLERFRCLVALVGRLFVDGGLATRVSLLGAELRRWMSLSVRRMMHVKKSASRTSEID